MTLEYKQSLTELNTIIHYMDMEYLKKIPQKFINFISENMDSNYEPNISKNIPINEQTLKKDTRVLLSLLHRNYWCDEESKTELIKEDLLAKDIYEKELREKYNPDNIFKNKKEQIDNISTSQVQENVTSLVEYKEQTWYQKIFENIRNFFINLFKKG